MPIHPPKPLPSVKQIIAVASGKGGVGKSTTAVNLALALAADGAKVGMLDADIYGPSQPMLLGDDDSQVEQKDAKLVPLMLHGIQVMSMGYLIAKGQAVVWRGPMAGKALQQLFFDTAWDDLDYLIVDLPPGTGDVQLTMAQKIPVTGALIVTTPQDLALIDAKKSIAMFEKVNVPVLGIIENMSTHICSECGHEEAIFGAGGGSKVAEQFGVNLLGQLPLDLKIREQADSGKPTVVAEPEGSLALLYRDIAKTVRSALSSKPTLGAASRFPRIEVE